MPRLKRFIEIKKSFSASGCGTIWESFCPKPAHRQHECCLANLHLSNSRVASGRRSSQSLASLHGYCS
eukprot:9655372-Alexandrium_andersonii.AAC.1